MSLFFKKQEGIYIDVYRERKREREKEKERERERERKERKIVKKR